MMDRLTPSGAIKESDGIRMMLGMPGVVAMCHPPMVSKSHIDLVGNAFITLAQSHMNNAEIVIWDNELYAAATAGSQAFVGSTVPTSFCEGANETWMFAVDARPPAKMLASIGLDPDWLTIAYMFSRSRAQRLPPDFLSSPMFTLLPDEVKKEALRSWENQGKLTVNNMILYGRPEEWLSANATRIYHEPTLRIMPGVQVFEGDTVTPATATILAAHQFMNGTVATARQYAANHQTRKEFKRRQQEVPTVKAVVLRRSEQSHNETGSMRSDVEWSCQWLVRGHWRRLTTPRAADGATVTYVQPYAKGPEDKPFRAPTQSVYVAKR